MRVAAAEFRAIKGAPKFYTVTGDSGNKVNRGFCSECGSPLFSRLSGMPGIVGVRVGSLDNPSRYHPVMDTFVTSAQPWDSMNPELPKFPGYPKR